MPQPQIQRTAFLNALIDTTTGLPVVVQVSISSNPPGSSLAHLNKEMWVGVHSATADTYGEASDRLRNLVQETDQFKWARPFLDDGQSFLRSKQSLVLSAFRSICKAAGWPFPHEETNG